MSFQGLVINDQKVYIGTDSAVNAIVLYSSAHRALVSRRPQAVRKARIRAVQCEPDLFGLVDLSGHSADWWPETLKRVSKEKLRSTGGRTRDSVCRPYDG